MPWPNAGASRPSGNTHSACKLSVRFAPLCSRSAAAQHQVVWARARHFLEGEIGLTQDSRAVARGPTAYGIGAVAAFWTIERVVGMVA